MPLTPLAVTPLAPAAPAEATGRRWSVAASALLHVLVIALVIGIAARQPPQGESGAPSYDLVFEGSGPAAPNKTQTPALPPMQPADIPVPDDAPPGPPAPAAMSPPAPDAASSAQPQAADAQPAPLPAPEAPETAPSARPAPIPPAQVPPAPSPLAPATTPAPAPGQPTLAPPRLAFAPQAEPAVVPEPAPVEVLPTPNPPAVRLEEPPAAEPEPQAAPIMPLPPPLPATPPRPRPIQRATPGTLSNPMDLSFGPAAPRPAARGSVASRAIDLSPPPERQGPARSDPYAAIRAASASADWNRGLLQFWLRHRYYPQKAAQEGEQGTVTIQLTVNRSGKVEDVEVVSRSGSQWLDMAAVGTFRGAQLPPFTNEMRQDRLTFPIPITYYLIR